MLTRASLSSLGKSSGAVAQPAKKRANTIDANDFEKILFTVVAPVNLLDRIIEQITDNELIHTSVFPIFWIANINGKLHTNATVDFSMPFVDIQER